MSISSSLLYVFVIVLGWGKNSEKINDGEGENGSVGYIVETQYTCK